MSSGGYLSFAECIINRWTSRSALILGNGRNAESSADTHIRAAHPPWAAAAAAQGDVMCVWIFIAQCMYPLFVCSCACMHVCLLCMRICGVCVCVCGCLCGPTMWQKNSPLTLSPLHWFTWSDLITSKCTTVSAVRSAAARQSDDTVCAVMLDFAPDKGLLHQFLIEWLIKHNSSLGYAAGEWAGQPTRSSCAGCDEFPGESQQSVVFSGDTWLYSISFWTCIWVRLLFSLLRVSPTKCNSGFPQVLDRNWKVPISRKKTRTWALRVIFKNRH